MVTLGELEALRDRASVIGSAWLNWDADKRRDLAERLPCELYGALCPLCGDPLSDHGRDYL